MKKSSQSVSENPGRQAGSNLKPQKEQKKMKALPKTGPPRFTKETVPAGSNRRGQKTAASFYLWGGLSEGT